MSASASPLPRYVVGAWAVVVLATLIRLIAAARLPLSGDEAYYWEWSRRLAFGYYDHPPMVAWIIALFTLGAKSALLVRLPFVLCGLGSCIALGAFVSRATRDARAGATAALLLALVPFATIAFTMATPDGPFLFFWSLSLYLGWRALGAASPVWRLPLALCVAAATLSRVLGVVLALGIIYALAREARVPKTGRERPTNAAWYSLLALVLFAAAITPYLLWDSAHGWSALQFALRGRHDTQFHGGNIISLLGIYAIVLTPGVFVGVFAALARIWRQASPAETLLFATAVPLFALCLGLALREQVEFYWADGAFVSLIGAIGFYSPALLRGLRGLLIIGPAAAIAALLCLVSAAPLETYQFAQRHFGLHLRHAGPFEIWAFEPAAREVAREAAATHAWVMTDGYGLSSVLDFYGSIPPIVIGYDKQGREARRWASPDVPSQAIFFDKEPLDSRPDFQRQLARACAKVRDDGERSYYVRGILARTFYLTRCEGLTKAGFGLLLWGTALPAGNG